MVVVIAEQQSGILNPASLEAIAAAQQLAAPVRVLLPGPPASEGSAAALTDADVADVVALEHPGLASYTADGFVTALAAFLAAEPPDLVLVAHTYQARDYVPRLAARLGRALVTDVTAIARSAAPASAGTGTGPAGEGTLRFTRPVFQGKLTADVVLDGPTPHFATIQIGAFRRDAVRKGTGPARLHSAAASIGDADIRQVPEAPFREAKQAVDLSQAERIVAVGRGIREEQHLAIVRDLAAALDAEIAASRPICDAGWLPMDRQVGSSGQTVTPKLYVALGISGAIQHLVGMKGARTIVAVNKDPDAPIFEVADYGIVGDLFEVVPAMVAALRSD
jgi:electron transfer flavoprotein alpha subunit